MQTMRKQNTSQSFIHSARCDPFFLKRLIEANKHGYWNASDDELGKLRDAYLELEGFIEEGLS